MERASAGPGRAEGLIFTTKLTKDTKEGTKKEACASRGFFRSNRNLVCLVCLVVESGFAQGLTGPAWK